MTSEPPANVLFLTYKHPFDVEILLKPHVLHSSSAFRSGTSAPFLGQNITFSSGSGFLQVLWTRVVIPQTLLGALGETMALIIITEIT
jgi:hypothetical protein